MEERRIAVFLDNAFLIIGIWLLSYLWTRYYVMNLFVALIAATGIALCVVMLINLKRHKNRRKKIKQKHIDAIMNQFLYGGKDFSLDFFYSALGRKYNVQKLESFILAGKTAVFPRFTFSQTTFQNIVDCYIETKKINAKLMIILSPYGCDKTAKQSIPHLPDIKINIFDKRKCYELLGWLGEFPEIRTKLAPQKTSVKKILYAALSKEKSRHYLFVSIVLLISSYFVMYSIYYIVAASLTLTLSLLAKFDIMKRFVKKHRDY